MAGVCKKNLTRNSLAVQLLRADGKGVHMPSLIRVRCFFGKKRKYLYLYCNLIFTRISKALKHLIKPLM